MNRVLSGGLLLATLFLFFFFLSDGTETADLFTKDSSPELSEREETQDSKFDNCSVIFFTSDSNDLVLDNIRPEDMISAAIKPGGGDLRDRLCLLRNFSLSAGSSLNMLSSCSSVVDTFTGAVTVHMGGFPDAEFAEVGEVRSGGH